MIVDEWPIYPGEWDLTPVEINRAQLIKGWMQEWELYWLAKEAKKHHTIIELGSYLGRSTRALADNTPGFVYAIDDWIGPRETISGDPIPDIEKDSWGVFQRNMKDLIEKKKVIPIKADHHGMCTILPALADMIFIDGDHTYERVRGDILRWRGQLKPGGLLCGHDASWPGVEKALNELVPNYKVVENTDIWYDPS